MFSVILIVFDGFCQGASASTLAASVEPKRRGVCGEEGGNITLDCSQFEVNNRAKILWRIRDAKEKDQEFHNQTCEQKVVRGTVVRQELWDQHLEPHV